jgi:hypothetical protein
VGVVRERPRARHRAVRPLHPGDNAVDWLALDGYNGGGALPRGGWRSPREVFGASLADLRALSDRPVLITEVGRGEQGGDARRRGSGSCSRWPRPSA